MNAPEDFSITYWDRVAPVKTFTLRPDFEMLAKRISRDAFVLDYGCGYGRTLYDLYRMGFTNTLGLDISGAMIERGKSAYPYLRLRQTKHAHTNLPDRSVDMVLLLALLTSVVDSRQQKKLMQEFQRILKPGGFVYIMDFLLNEDERNLKRYAAFERKYGVYGVFDLPEGVTLRHHTTTYVKELLQGFETVCFKKTKNKTMNGHWSNGFVFIGRKQSFNEKNEVV